MRIGKAASKWVAVLLIALVTGLTAHFAQQSWRCHAWLSLLAKGHFNVQLRDPSEQAFNPHVFASRLVYAKGEYVGYIDPYGHFVGKSEQSVDLKTEGNIMISLYVLEFTCGALFLLGVFRTLRHARRHVIFIEESPNSHHAG